MNKTVDLVLIIPVYNFATGIDDTLDRLARWEPSLSGNSVAVIFSDDGSSDGTAARIQARIEQDRPHWQLHRSAVNRGKGRAIRDGIDLALQSDPELIVFTDCDLHYGLSIIEDRLLPQLRTADIVIADRSLGDYPGNAPILRRLASAVFNRLVALLTGITFRDTQAGLKGFRVASCRPLFDVMTLDGFAFDVELLSVALYHRFRIERVPVHFIDEAADMSSSVNLIASSLHMLKDLLRINWNWKRGRYESAELRRRNEEYAYTVRDKD